MVTVVICYAKGTQRVLRACLASLKRHEAGTEHRVVVYTDNDGFQEARELCVDNDVRNVICPPDWTGSRKHGFLLDTAMKQENGLVLTLDSDCLVVGDGWLEKLVGKHEIGYQLPGILWPWEPPSPSMDKTTFEWRVRKVHNWNNSWVACQLVDSSVFKDNFLSYTDGDDTGFKLIERATSLGTIGGFMPTGCAKPEWASGFDPEMNRHMCVIYGDCIVHLGGGSAVVEGKVPDIHHLYAGAIEKTLRMGSANWMLEPHNMHRYRFDNEEEVAAFKMKLLNDGIRRHLVNHASVF